MKHYLASMCMLVVLNTIELHGHEHDAQELDDPQYELLESLMYPTWGNSG